MTNSAKSETAGAVRFATGSRTKSQAAKVVLVVDDHDALLRLNCEILEMVGYRTVATHSAAEALEMLDQNRIDAVVTDFRMEGMDGLELARAIRIRSPQMPIIMVTGYGAIEDNPDLTLCLTKNELFPALINQLKTILTSTENSS